MLILHRAGRPLTVAELAQRLHSVGLAPARPHATRAISDVLRTERGLGRVIRVSRGTYAVGDLTRQARWKMRRRLDDLGIVW